ncbi:VanZ family protein [Peptoniphilus sp. KCTC 25270]|uniref:VanZ family protein n=1 Tax=Peptoniphilus sp. KCTC 25270 TaxID=2897414 RepID=UPI001E5A080B|nr:VanZ family protein [Peptoniphilus sp. KCTC 25270]MCD1147656.1 VanZ family protein [Peptoniphilus sp. KCTC 25270]
MIRFILWASPLILFFSFFGTAFIRTNFFRKYKRRSNPKRERLLLLISTYLLWLGFFLLISNQTLDKMGISLGIDPTIIRNQEWSLNLVPFKTITNFSKHLSGFHLFTNIWGNVLIAVPIGLFFPILWRRFQNPLPLYLWMGILSLIIETIQFFIGRTADIDDVFLYFIGLIIGYFIQKILKPYFPQKIYQR